MKARKIRRIIKDYQKLLTDAGVEPVDFPHNQRLSLDCRKQSLGHVYTMLSRMENFIAQNQMGKVYRWLGFVQGVLWVNGLLSVGEMKEENRCD